MGNHERGVPQYPFPKLSTPCAQLVSIILLLWGLDIIALDCLEPALFI